MARYYAEIKGSRGPATRMGSPNSGIWGHIRGWSVGVKVSGVPNDQTGADEFHIYATSGSNGVGDSVYLGKVTLVNGKPTLK